MTIQDIINNYKSNVEYYWEEEKYKWIAVKHFQKNWDIDAPDFAGMVAESFRLAKNLLAGGMYYAYGMLCNLSQQNPDVMRSLFQMLYTEDIPLAERLNSFRSCCNELLKEFQKNHPDSEKAKNHYQDLRAICVYLSFKYPEKYYLYKDKMYRDFKNLIGFQETSTEKSGTLRKYENFSRMCETVLEAITGDVELLELQSKLVFADYDCYDDSACHLLVQTIIYVSRGIDIDDFTSSARYKKWFGPIVEALYALGGEASRPEVHSKIKSMCSLTDSDLEKKNDSGISVITNDIDWARNYLSYEGIIDNSAPNGIWKLSELGKKIIVSDDLAGKIIRKWVLIKQAQREKKPIPNYDLSPYYTYRDKDDWFPSLDQYTPGFTKEKWLAILNSPVFSDPEARGALAAFYEAGGAATCKQIAMKYNRTAAGIACYCVNFAKRIYRETNCSLYKDENRTRYWTILFRGKSAENDTPGSYVWKLRPELYDALTEFGILRFLWDDYNIDSELFEEFVADFIAKQYTEEDFLSEVYLPREKYQELKNLLKYKKNIILQGAPGVGKTFAARKLAYSLIGWQSEEQVAFVQFHQNYSYEDFVMGYKPDGDGFTLKKGIFYKFCERASSNPDKDFFFLIDEINRGNLSKIFGELLMLLEKDYRNTQITLAYSGEQFMVPKNLYLIGMMNTADRSLALIDYALCRRFSFFDMEPGFDSDGFRAYQKRLSSDRLDLLIQKVKELNRKIAQDKTLGKGFCIGHSYFCGCENCSDDWLRSIVEYDILPTLSEYWFDDTTELERWKSILQGVFQ